MKGKVLTEDSNKIWIDYYQRKKSQRVEEAINISECLRDAGVNKNTILALDFLHFGASQSEVEALASQLSENYRMQVIPGEEKGYWYAKGTTRPYGITFNQEQLIGWVEFMSDVAQSYACVFSTWSIEAPSLGVKLHSEKIETDS